MKKPLAALLYSATALAFLGMVQPAAAYMPYGYPSQPYHGPSNGSPTGPTGSASGPDIRQSRAREVFGNGWPVYTVGISQETRSTVLFDLSESGVYGGNGNVVMTEQSPRTMPDCTATQNFLKNLAEQRIERDGGNGSVTWMVPACLANGML